MGGSIEFVELTDSGQPIEVPPSRRPGLRRAAVATAVLGALAVGIGAVAVHGRSATTRALAAPAVTPISTPGPAFGFRRPTVLMIDAGDVAGICPPGTCRLVQTSQYALYQELVPFGQLGVRVVARGGATVQQPDGSVLGTVAQESLSNGVSIALTVLRASGAPPRAFERTRFDRASTVTLATRRSGWDFVASVTAPGMAGGPTASARSWLQTAPLPS